MFGIKNLLKISLLIAFIITITACKPILIPEEIKEAYGAYAYNIGDSINLFISSVNKLDTFSIFVIEKSIYRMGSMVMSIPELEYYWLSIKDIEGKIEISIFLEADNVYPISIHNKNYGLGLNHLKILNYFDTKEIDGISYDNVYYLADTIKPFSMYSSKNYGFIKIWNDTITYKFER